VEANRKTRQRYWTHWVDFLLCGFDPYLQNLDGKQQLAELQAFAQRAREGTFGQGRIIHTGSVQAAIKKQTLLIRLWQNFNCPGETKLGGLVSLFSGQNLHQ